ncbi:hypothetical protein BGX31_004070 [Mortierella sp. GBA43]|nr:hypothetical protein BGX31_004070 [Mortierella sp. GBA43]
MNSALRALFCTTDFKEAILSNTLKVDPTKVITTRLRETFSALSTSRLAIATPTSLYKALPDWLNDGHQQDAAEFTKILFSKLEDEDPASKRVLDLFRGTLMNQVRCSQCGNTTSHKEDFYDLTIPTPRADDADLQAIVNIFPSTEELNDDNNNKYYCDHCQSLQDAKRFTMLETLPTNLILSLSRFEYDTQKSRRIKIDTPIHFAKSIQMKMHNGNEVKDYDLYAVVIHTGKSANHGHYYTYARDSVDAGTTQSMIPWLLYNDTSVTISSFELMEKALAKNRTDTPYMLFFRRTDTKSNPAHSVLHSAVSNL